VEKPPPQLEMFWRFDKPESISKITRELKLGWI
jgi:hypothetical protein